MHLLHITAFHLVEPNLFYPLVLKGLTF